MEPAVAVNVVLIGLATLISLVVAVFKGEVDRLACLPLMLGGALVDQSAPAPGPLP